jgi:insulin-like growth factor 2 receptor
VDFPSKNDPSEFLINICKPTLYKHMEMCPPGSSVCLVNATETNLKDRFVSGGNVVANPIIDHDNQLVMKFPSTTKCSAIENLTSTIYFTCDDVNEVTGK